MTIAGHKPSGDNGWETPPHIFQFWHERFNFDLDVCAVPETAKLASYITPEQDALITPWGKRNWMNPPYGRGQIDKFARRAYEQSLEGKVIVGLLPVSTDTKWWNQYVKPASHIFFYPYRINFLRGNKPVKGVSFAPCIVIWGLHPMINRIEAGD